MPRKPKYTSEELIAVALDIVREGGFEALTARSLVDHLGTAPATVFTHFESMDAIKKRTFEEIRKIFKNYIVEGLKADPVQIGVAFQYIKFAATERQFFFKLFVGTHSDRSFDDMLTEEGLMDEICKVTSLKYNITEALAARRYRYLITFAHGLATIQCAGAGGDYDINSYIPILTNAVKMIENTIV